MLRVIFSLFILLNCSAAFSQLYYLNLPPGHNKLVVGDHRIAGVVGSPYLNDEWSKGTITLHNGQIIEDLPMKYNVYLKEMHYQADNNVYVLGAPDSVLFINLGDRRFMYLPFEEKKTNTQKDYFELITGNVSQLLVRHTITRLESNYNIALNAGEKNDRLEPKSDYYLRKDNAILLIDKKGESLYQLLADKSKEIRKFVSDNRLSFNRGEDLKRIVEYYDSFYNQ